MVRTRSNFLLGAAALGGLALSISSAAAQSVQTEKLHVEASVGEVCTVTAASLDFGPYEGVALPGTGNIDISCIADTDLDITLDGGLGPNNGSGIRGMLNGSDSLTYTLYVDAAGGGDTWDTGEAVPVSISGTDSVQVYGLVHGLQNGIAGGLYTDEVTITLIF